MPTKYRRINLTCSPAFIKRLERFMLAHGIRSHTGAIMMLAIQKLQEFDED